MNAPHKQDQHLVLHSLLTTGLALGVAAVLLFVIPDLFDRHSTPLDLLALGIVIATCAFAWLAGRALWRAHPSDGDKE